MADAPGPLAALADDELLEVAQARYGSAMQLEVNGAQCSSMAGTRQLTRAWAHWREATAERARRKRSE